MRFRFTLKHQLPLEALQFTNNEFESSISGWDQINSGSEQGFVWNNPSSVIADGTVSNLANTAAIGQICPTNPDTGWPPGTYTVAITATNTSTGGSSPFVSGLNIYGSDTGAALDDAILYLGDDGEWEVGAGEITQQVIFTTTQHYQKIFFKFTKQGVNTGYEVIFTIDSIELIRVNGATTDHEINEPDGWKGAKIILDRDPQFCDLVEIYEGSAGGAFIFYGENSVEDGGINFIKEIEQTYGLDANIEFLSEMAPDDVNYETIFSGLLELSGKNEMKDNKMQVPVIRDDFWAKFFNRMDTPVNLSDLFDLDGNPVDECIPITVNLTSQKIRYIGEYTWSETVQYPNPVGDGLIQLDWDTTIVDDLDKSSLPRVDIEGTPVNLITGLFEAPDDGVYTFDIRVETGSFFGGSWQNALAEPRLRIGISGSGSGDDETVYELFTSSSIDNGSGQYLWVHTFNGSFTLLKGQQISIFGVTDNSAGTTNVFGERLNNWLTDVDAATTAAIVLSGTQTIDNYAAGIGDRILVKNQGDPIENGVWVVAAGAWSRSTDADTSAELQDATVFVVNGDDNADTYWIQNTENVNLGVTPITFRTTIYNDTKLVAYPGTGTPDNYIIITADTTFKETTAQGYLIHDLIHGVLSRIGLGNNPLYSEFLGSTFTNSRQYDDDGCGWMYVILKGLQLRQYTLAEKPFFISFKQIWDGINPILNLGLGYEVSDDSPDYQYIRIEQRDHFLEDDTSINFSNVREISSTYDQDFIFKTIKTGYKKWQSEDVSGIDDPQTKQTRATRFEKVGKDLTLESDFIAAGLSIEIIRRKTRGTDDYKYDNDNFIIALNQDDVSPDIYVPELDENFDSVTNLNNSDARYNLVLTPIRNFLRWANVIGGCLQSYATSSYKFVSGEGNYDMTSDYACGSGYECQAIICDSLTESDDISLAVYNAGFGYLHLPLLYDITIPMEWEEYEIIRANRKKAIGISQTSTGHIPFKIKRLEYDIVMGQANIKAWPKTFLSIGVPEQDFTMSCSNVPVETPTSLDGDLQDLLDFGEDEGFTLPSDEVVELLDDLITDLKEAQIWTDLDILYIFATDGDADFASLNLIDPTTFKATRVNNPEHIPNDGFEGNGTDSYLNTGWIPATDGLNYTQNDNAAFTVINNEFAEEGNKFHFGTKQGATGRILLQVKDIGSDILWCSHSGGIEFLTTNTAPGFYQIQRTGVTSQRILKNGVELDTDTSSSNGISPQPMYLLCLNETGTAANFSGCRMGVFGAGKSFNGKETELYNIFNQYLTALSLLPAGSFLKEDDSGFIALENNDLLIKEN